MAVLHNLSMRTEWGRLGDELLPDDPHADRWTNVRPRFVVTFTIAENFTRITKARWTMRQRIAYWWSRALRRTATW